MATKNLQRTLVLNLGNYAAVTGNLVLSKLEGLIESGAPLAGIGVITDESLSLPFLSVVGVTDKNNFAAWKAELQQKIEQSLLDISQLEKVSQMAQFGLTFSRADEVHLMLIADMAELWLCHPVETILDIVQQQVQQRLKCYFSVSGVFLYTFPESNSDSSNVPIETDVWVQPGQEHWFNQILFNRLDRGCLLLGPTNEAGLIVGNTETFAQKTANLLALILQHTGLSADVWQENNAPGWNSIMTSAGLATARWPGRELANILCNRWIESFLSEMVEPVKKQGTEGRLAHKARQAVQQWLTTQHLPPILLIERIAGVMPPLPHYLAELVPQPAWPWQLVETPERLDWTARRWQEIWLSERQSMDNVLVEIINNWAEQADQWLQQQLASLEHGAVLGAESYIAVISEMLHAFIEGVEQKREEAETDLAHLEQKISQLTETLLNETSRLPDSPLGALFRWGPRPLRWPHFVFKCRQIQKRERNLAHLIRAKLSLWQTILYYDTLLPFYEQLLEEWHQTARRWSHLCQEISNARRSPQVTEWPQQLDELLKHMASPWSASLITNLYHQAFDRLNLQARDEAGSLATWVTAGLTAGELLERLRNSALPTLESFFDLPADEALCLQLPSVEGQTAWLTGLLEQARPFWRYDETALPESSRSQIRLEQWLLLPSGQKSPLVQTARLCARPPAIATGISRDEIVAVTVRQWELPWLSEGENDVVG
ncbi:MAG: hypothetical protein D6706_11635 [Chloroflexi bacterium]|nr:MAG: hypothetical protein D6706_11635 [Chloroflexota bacterium]